MSSIALPTPEQSQPKATLHTLPHADGSASYAWLGYAIAATVNGPIEPQRRDEDPDAAVLEVLVRPVSGPGGTSCPVLLLPRLGTRC